jgi:hypothetical protein
MRNATAVDIVKRLTGSLYQATSEHPNALAPGMGAAQNKITAAVDDAIDLGWIRVVETRDTNYGKNIRMLALADGISYCRTCITGCDHESSAGKDAESCGHLGCWGPNATNDCAGVKFARTAVLGQAEWAEIDAEPTGVRA